MLKCDFHMHSLEDPRDVLDHDAFELIDHAARLKYHVLALTLHRKLHYPQELLEYAKSRGILLISGVELYLQGREVLLLGATEEEAHSIKNMEDLRSLKQKRGNEILTIVPHPFYVLSQCLGSELLNSPDLFDAIEFCHFYTTWWNPNLKAEKVARQIGKPMIACSDTHRLKWMESHYCLIHAKPDQNEIFAAIRAGHIQNISRPLSNEEFLKKMVWHFAWHYALKIGIRLGLLKRSK